MNTVEFLSPQEAWKALCDYRDQYYRQYAAVYSGDRDELRKTSKPGLFWARDGKAKIHMGLAGDIAATSADLLFGEEAAFSSEEAMKANSTDNPQQARLDKIVTDNNIGGTLSEAAESCAVLGDVFLKISYWRDGLECPILSAVQADSAWAEYVVGALRCVHFFSVAARSAEGDRVLRIYERYEKGKITTKLFLGDSEKLGREQGADKLKKIGIEADNKLPVDEMLAVHIPNVRPNRRFRDSRLGRSDLDGLRDELDSLDEAYSSWMRDIRLAKARQIVPAEYLRRRPEDMFEGGSKFTYEFDEDVETFVALDIDPSRLTNPIIASQFAIRADEHAKTCADLIRNIVTEAGYSPQTFGMDISGNAQSGSALRIREKKSASTRNKKQTYWAGPLTAIMTALVRLDAALYPTQGSSPTDSVDVQFADTMSSDLSTISAALMSLNSAIAMSTEEKVRTLHPDWSDQDVTDEAARIAAENGFLLPAPDMGLGDLEKRKKTVSTPENKTPTAEGEGGEA